MIVKIIEATNLNAGGMNWGKFLIGRFDHEWQHKSLIYADRELLPAIGWSKATTLVFDLQTGEGAFFHPGGLAGSDLMKHKIWVCPLFEPFLEWLYNQDLSDISILPSIVEITNPASALAGYRRPGK